MGLFEYIIKAKSGVYKDNPENRRLHRVGQRYGQRKIVDEGNNGTKLPSKETLLYWNNRKNSLGDQYKTISSLEEFRDNKFRELLREKLIQETVSKATRHFDKPKAVFCLGGAASGKSSSLASLGYDGSKIPCQLNPDEYQEKAFQGDNMFYNWTQAGSGAGRLHDETSAMTKEAYKRVLATGGDFVKDGVMGNYEKALADIQAAIDAGYEPEIVGVSLDTDEAIKRCYARYERAEEKEKYSGRLVPEGILRSGHSGAATTFARLMMEHPEFKLKLFDNNVERGEKPILVYDSTKQPPILDKDKVLQFFKKSVAFNEIKDYMEMKNDLAKSILDNPYNRVEGGRKIELFDILDKYRYQRQNRQLSNLDAYAEDIGATREELLAYQNWINDGKPTGIESDEQYYELQRQAYGKIVIKLSWLI